MSRLKCWGLVVVLSLISAGSSWGQELELDLLVAPGSPAESPVIREQQKHLPLEQSGRVLILRQPSLHRTIDRINVVDGLVEYPARKPLDVPVSPLQAANAQRQQLIDSLQALQDTYCRNAQLDEALAVRNMIRQLKQQVEQASRLPDPVTASAAVETSVPIATTEPIDIRSLRGQNQVAFYRKVTGTVEEYTWGGKGNVYTDDSALSTAAVHAGVLKPGETAVVRITILPGLESYPGITRNGVTTRPWQSWGGSYRIDGAAKELSNVYNLRGQDSAPFAVYVVGNLNGTVWGSGSYTDDSDLGTAAVHAGLLKPGEAGFVKVTLEGGKSAYESSTQNGVTTRPFSNWEGGFRLSAFPVTLTTDKTQPWPGYTLDVF
jgi:hypothetical protein